MMLLLHQDWYRSQSPDSDPKGYYLTSLPVILFEMLEQNVSRFTIKSSQVIYFK